MLRYTHSSTKWQTKGGTFRTKWKARIEFKLPKFSHNKTITWIAHVDETTDTVASQYNITIRTNLMVELKLKINYTTREIHWDDTMIPMKQRRTISDPEMTQAIYKMSKALSELKCQKKDIMKLLKQCTVN